MNESVSLWNKPTAANIVMIAGWRQWADAGSISSGLPEYLIEQTKAEPIGEIKPDGFYLFQIPATHHLLRPRIRFEDGHRQYIEVRRNEFYYAGDDEKGLIIFIGDEPHLDVDRYADAFFDVAAKLNVSQIASIGGVYGPVPYDKNREIGCMYSLPQMRQTLDEYALRFSDYEGGASIGSYLIDRAEVNNIPFAGFFGFVPNYDFSQLGISGGQEVRVENDYKAWLDIMRRINHLFDLNLSLADLERRSEQLMEAMAEQLEELAEKLPQLNMNDIMQQIAQQFTEQTFAPLDDVWQQGLADLFDDGED